ncbi:EF-hand domain-containing protein [Candidatus Parcubacteria bacterium]|nr:MAG: EF-hand domain-containing protein [Candidatus Parcubacteria bacterium]
MKKAIACIALASFALAGSALAGESDKVDVQAMIPPPGSIQFPPGLDANHDGKVSRKENQRFAEKMFNETDTNHDGYITREEMRQYIIREIKQNAQQEN